MPDNVTVGRTRVWKDGRECVTDFTPYFPELTHARDSLRVRLWKAASCVTCLTIGCLAKAVLRVCNTTIVHGKEHLDRAFQRDSGVPLVRGSKPMSAYVVFLSFIPHFPDKFIPFSCPQKVYEVLN